MWQRTPPWTRPTIPAAPSTSGAPESPGRPSMLVKRAFGRFGRDGQRPMRSRRALWKRGRPGLPSKKSTVPGIWRRRTIASGSTSAGSSRKRTAWSLASFTATTHAVRSEPVERRTRRVRPFTQCFAVTMTCGFSATTPAQPVVSTTTPATRSARRTGRSLPACADSASSMTRATAPPGRAIESIPYDGPGRLLFGRRERDDVVEARVVDAPHTVRLPGEDVDEARPPRDVARLVAMARVDGLGEVLVVAHERDDDLRLRRPEGGGGRAVEGARLGDGM